MKAVLIVSRNNLHLTKVAVRTAVAQDCQPQVLVADNHSTDGTSEWLRTKSCASVSYPFQLSLSDCWNRSLRTLFFLRAKKVLVCNNDISLRPDTYRLLESLDLPFVSCVSVNCPSQMGTPGDRTVEDLQKSIRPHPDFSCFMISREAYEEVGEFDVKYYPAYCEDNDYHVRMHHRGVQAVCVDLPFLHLGAQTVKNADEGERARILRGADASRGRFRLKYRCLPGTPEYSMLFSESRFGCEV